MNYTYTLDTNIAPSFENSIFSRYRSAIPQL